MSLAEWYNFVFLLCGQQYQQQSTVKTTAQSCHWFNLGLGIHDWPQSCWPLFVLRYTVIYSDLLAEKLSQKTAELIQVRWLLSWSCSLCNLLWLFYDELYFMLAKGTNSWFNICRTIKICKLQIILLAEHFLSCI